MIILYFLVQLPNVYVFINEDYSDCTGTVVVHNQSTLCSTLIIESFKGSNKVTTASAILNPNNGLAKHTQFF